MDTPKTDLAVVSKNITDQLIKEFDYAQQNGIVKMIIDELKTHRVNQIEQLEKHLQHLRLTLEQLNNISNENI